MSRVVMRLGRLPLLPAAGRAELEAAAVALAFAPLRQRPELVQDPELRYRLRLVRRRLLRAQAASRKWTRRPGRPAAVDPVAPRSLAFALGMRVLALALLIWVLCLASANLAFAAYGQLRGRQGGDQTMVFGAALVALFTCLLGSRLNGRSPLLIPARAVVPAWLHRSVSALQGDEPRLVGAGSPAPEGRAPEVRLDSWLRWALPTLLLVASALVSLIPAAAMVRGLVVVLSQSSHLTLGDAIGLGFAFIALSCGSIFFAYSVKYYLSTAVIAWGSLFQRPEGGPLLGDELVRINHRRTGSGLTPLEAPFISVHIAAYNESRVIERLLEACAAFDYPNYEVILVDDSTEPASLAILERWRERPGFKILHRSSRDGFKGGALKLALQQTDPRAQYVAIFDADAVPFPDTLRRLLPHFYEADASGEAVLRGEVAAVQSYQWHVLNKSESWLTQAVRTEYSGSYMIERPFQEVLGSLKMVAGTAYMIRIDRLRELGWGRSITEDWELTLRLYARGYKVAYTPSAETPAECVSTFQRLVKQRMRWAEGHSFNVRRHFGAVMRSPFVSPIEKIEFAFYATYYLQALFLLVGTGAWLVSEAVFHVRIPDWTALLGYSLIFSNALSLPLMNVSGLMLEDAPRRDYGGVLGAVLLAYLLVPYQGWAALKGLFEKEEGTWNRTPKTGRVTDPIRHLRALQQLRRWMLGRWTGNRPRLPRLSPVRVQKRMQRWAWFAIAGMTAAFGFLGVAAVDAPVAYASPSQLYLADSQTGANGDWLLGAEGTSNNLYLTNGSLTWATAPGAANGLSLGTYSFYFGWGNGDCHAVGDGCVVTVSVGYASNCDVSLNTCATQTQLFTFPDTNVIVGTDGNATLTAVEPGFTFTNCPCAVTLTVTVSDSNLHFLYGGTGSNKPNNASLTTPTIVVPESSVAAGGAALLVPLVFQLIRWRRRRPLPG